MARTHAHWHTLPPHAPLQPQPPPQFPTQPFLGATLAPKQLDIQTCRTSNEPGSYGRAIADGTIVLKSVAGALLDFLADPSDDGRVRARAARAGAPGARWVHERMLWRNIPMAAPGARARAGAGGLHVQGCA